MNLAATQNLFYRLVTRDPGVGAEEAARCFVGTPAMPASERVEIYADMYLWRLVDSMRDDFPKLAALLGDDLFFELCGSYVAAHPSEHPDLGQFARRFSGFLQSQADRTARIGRSDLVDLAALEWARTEVFFEAPAVPVPVDAFSALGENLAGARIRLVPALRILRLGHDAAALWRRLEDDQPPEPPQAVATGVVVWRAGFEVFHTRIDQDEILALERAMAGAPLSEVCAAFESRPQPAEAAFGALTSWLAEGWITSADA